MRAVLHGGFVDYVQFMGVSDRYPKWFEDEVMHELTVDPQRFTLWAPEFQRTPDYYEMTVVAEHSVFLRKPNGDIFCTSWQTFSQLYTVFSYDGFSNYGVAAYNDDCIDYVELYPGVISPDYPDWFYEFVTEVANLPMEETILMYDTTKTLYQQAGSYIIKIHDEVTVDTHCVFLKNLHGEIRHMEYGDFLKHYNPGPIGGMIFNEY